MKVANDANKKDKGNACTDGLCLTMVQLTPFRLYNGVKAICIQQKLYFKVSILIFFSGLAIYSVILL